MGIILLVLTNSRVMLQCHDSHESVLPLPFSFSLDLIWGILYRSSLFRFLSGQQLVVLNVFSHPELSKSISDFQEILTSPNLIFLRVCMRIINWTRLCSTAICKARGVHYQL